MKLYARNNYLICEPYELTQSSNGLLIQNANVNKIEKVINADGANCFCDVDCKVGDIILYDTDKAKDYMLNGKKYIIINNIDVFAIVKENEE